MLIYVLYILIYCFLGPPTICSKWIRRGNRWNKRSYDRDELPRKPNRSLELHVRSLHPALHPSRVTAIRFFAFCVVAFSWTIRRSAMRVRQWTHVWPPDDSFPALPPGDFATIRLSCSLQFYSLMSRQKSISEVMVIAANIFYITVF